MRTGSRGFSLIETLLAILVIVMISSVGWYVLSSKYGSQSKPSSAKRVTASSETTNSKTKSSAIPSGWIWYQNSSINFKLAYPSGWTLNATQPQSCPFNSPLYGASSCPLFIELSPSDYLSDKRVDPSQGLLEAIFYAGSNLVSPVAAYNYDLGEYKTIDKASIATTNSLPTNQLSGYYIRATTSSWTDNLWSIKFPDFYVRYSNRETNAIYNGENGSVSDSINYSKYTSTITQIIKTTSMVASQ